MDYLNKFVTRNTSINNTLQLIKQFPVTRRLTDMYSYSSKNDLLFLGIAAFITVYNLSVYIKAKREKLNLPPSVSFSLPLVGYMLYLMYMPNKFIDWCNEKYGDVYDIDILGRTVTITSGKSAEEVMKAESSDLSLQYGFIKDVLHLHYIFDSHAMHVGFHANPIVAKVVIPSQTMPYYIPGIQRGLEIAASKLLSKDEPTLIKQPSCFFQNFVAYMTVPTLIGAEVATNPEVIRTFADFTGDIIKNIVIFLLVPTFLHRFILPYLQSATKHQKIMETHVVPVIEQRRKKMRQALEAGEEHGLEQNFLQGLMEYVHTYENGVQSTLNTKEIADDVLLIAFAAVHTTSMNLSFSLYWLVARPDLMKRLMEEIDRVVPGNTPITAEALGEMKFLNNFIREVLRQGVDRLANGRKAMYDFTFSNGYQVPKGRTVESNMRQLNFGNNSERADVESMDPDMSNNKTSTSPGKDFVTFGMGKHLCPGRFFAIQEIQMSLVHLLKHFEVKTASGKRPEPVMRIAGTIAVNSEEPLIFTPRK